jgi:hypothetical protein
MTTRDIIFRPPGSLTPVEELIELRAQYRIISHLHRPPAKDELQVEILELMDFILNRIKTLRDENDNKSNGS